MRAAVHTRYGPPEVVEVREAPRPVPASDEILVEVHASTVNRTDCGFRAAHPFVARFFTGLIRPRSTILGSEFAGVVAEIGDRVTTFALGDRVFGYSEGASGAHAEYLTMAETGSVATMPDGWGFEAIVPATEGAHYALNDIRAAGVANGHRVLVNGATGAIGSAAVQISNARGARVTATCRGEHRDLVLGLGADRVIDYTAADFTADLETYDFVFDAVGKSTFGRCRKLLTPRGVYISSELGPGAQNLALALITRLGRGRKVMFPFPVDNQRVVQSIKQLLENGQFEPVIDRVYALADIVEAYRYVESGQKVGNVVIRVRGEAAT